MARFRGDPESREQARVVKLYRMAGCRVYPTSRQRAQGCAGLPDLYVIHSAARDWWHEVKAPGGKLRREQQEFVNAADAHVVVGGYDEAVKHLENARIIVPQSKKVRAAS